MEEISVDDADSESEEAEFEPSGTGLRATTASAPEHGSDFRLAWLWAEGWRARLRRSGDIVEQTRWEWRLEHMRRPNRVPEIVTRMPGVLVAAGKIGVGRERAKSVHWA
jgi:hypothetical protein